MRSLPTVAGLCAALTIAGCGVQPTIPGIPAYRMEIQQGNYVSQEMVAQLKPGMTRDQVRFVLGTPLVTDIFHADRWDYVYLREPPGKPREHRRLAVFFSGDKLVRVDGDVVPASAAGEGAPMPPKEEPRMPPKPVALPETRPADPGLPQQNWRTATDPEPAAEPARPQPAKPAPAAEAPAKAATEERGFFGRMWDKVRGND